MKLSLHALKNLFLEGEIQKVKNDLLVLSKELATEHDILQKAVKIENKLLNKRLKN